VPAAAQARARPARCRGHMADVDGLAGTHVLRNFGTSCTFVAGSCDGDTPGSILVTQILPLVCGIGAVDAFLVNEMVERMHDPNGMLPVLAAFRTVGQHSPYEVPYFVALAVLIFLSCVGGGAAVIVILWGIGDNLTQKADSPLASYTLSKKLGEGAFGTVWRATKLVPNKDGGEQKDFALKIIQIQRIKEANRGIAEAMRLACVDHRCVVTVYEHFFDKAAVSLYDRLFNGHSKYRLCIAQELCSGDLQSEIRSWGAAASDVIQRTPSIDSAISVTPKERPVWGQLLRIFREVVEGVEALHSKGIIHRDIKPANIFISADNKHVRIGDLGIAEKVETRQVAFEGLGKAGTAGYMAPEVIAGRAYSTRADNWSLGCVLMDMAYPTASGGWSVKQILDENGFHRPTAEAIRHVTQHPSLQDCALAKEIVSRCLLEDPLSRLGCAETLVLLDSVKRADSVALFQGWSELCEDDG